MRRIQIGNPPNSILPYALQVATLQVSTPLTRFFDDRIVIDLMTMDDVYLGLEFESQGSTNGNWSTIMRNLKQATGKRKNSCRAKGKNNICSHQKAHHHQFKYRPRVSNGRPPWCES